jgi:hypothetical protein
MKAIKIKIQILLTALMTAAFLIAPASVFAATASSNCGNTETTTNGQTKVSPTLVQKCLTNSPIIVRVQEVVDFLSVGVGIIVTGVILVGGIQYIVAGGNPQAVAAARQRITNGLIALFAFLFIFAFLQWLIPGGIFKK